MDYPLSSKQILEKSINGGHCVKRSANKNISENISPLKYTRKSEISAGLTVIRSPIRLLPEKDSPFPRFETAQDLQVTSFETLPNETILHCIERNNDCKSVTVHLRGLWSQTIVNNGAKVRVFDGKTKNSQMVVIDNSQGFVLFEPDTLIQSTSVSSAVFCRRKSVLNERFHGGSDPPNKQMLVGTIVHQLFQTAIRLRPRFLTERWLLAQFRTKMLDIRLISQLVAMKMKPVDLDRELSPFIGPMIDWIRRHVPDYGNDTILDQMQIVGIRDIEENIWCPRLGVRGKIDVSLVVGRKTDGKQCVEPLELKTGKTSNSADHQAQLLLYCLMLSSRTDQTVCQGTLLYLKGGNAFRVSPSSASVQGVLQLRNQLAYHLHHLVDRSSEPPSNPFPLPPPLNDVRNCHNCEHLLTCALHQRSFDRNPPSQSMIHLTTTLLAHLQLEHVQYFAKWTRWLCLEWMESKRNRPDIRDTWLSNAKERELTGQCIADLIVHSISADEQIFRVKLIKSGNATFPRGDFNRGDIVVISVESEQIACLLGTLCEISDHSVVVQSDKSLRDEGRQYRLDKYQSFATFGLNLVNLTKLMNADERSDRLRAILLDGQLPNFGKLPTHQMDVIRPFVRGLNRNQTRAVVKALLAEDYLLIKGLPGSGKTSTIVALTRCLMAVGKSVLLTAYTHSAVDNVLEKLLQCPEMNAASILRLSNSVRTNCHIESIYGKLDGLPKTALYDAMNDLFDNVVLSVQTVLSG